MISFTRINLSNFRNYEAARINLENDIRFAVLTGKNGAGKTNFLEALSLFATGSGMRGATLPELNKRGGSEADVWAVNAEIIGSDGDKVKIGTGYDRIAQKRAIRINGQDAKSQSELEDHVALLWLTPQMDGLFTDAASARRKFLDRLVSAYEPAHASHVARYDKAMRERSRLLQGDGLPDRVWLDGLEKQMAENSVAIAASRLNLISRLQSHVGDIKSVSPLFPEPSLAVDNWIEGDIAKFSAAEVEGKLRQKLLDNRAQDRESRKTADGTHKSDLQVSYAVKDMPAAYCSTGEQKALLISIILGHALMMQAEKGYVPVLLLDEVAAHLDDDRREQLFYALKSLDCQVWLTGTSNRIFLSLGNQAKFFYTDNGVITEQRG